MATIDTLQTWYRNIMRVQTAPAADAATVAGLAAQVDAGTLTLVAAQAAVAHLAINTTSVATLSYNFFTGATPRQVGLDYLVSPTGPNPNNINSAYYQNFNIENRYINFAVNVGKLGEGQARFQADYGNLTLSQALVKAYTEIFGAAPDAAKAASLLNDQVPNGTGGTYSRAEYFAFYGLDGPNGAGTKAAMVGWLLAQAAKEDIGAYAKANDAFLADLGPDGIASFQTNLVEVYGPPPSGAPGAVIAFAHDQSVGPTAANPALKSTDNADTITGLGGLDAGQSILAGGGADVIKVGGVVYGLIQTTDGGDIVTLGGVGATPATLGVPARYGAVVLAGSNNTVHLNGPMAQGTSITASGANNTFYLGGTAVDGQTSGGAVSGFQTLIMESNVLNGISFTGLQTVYDQVGPGLPAGTQIPLPGVANVVLKDTSYGVTIGYPIGTPTADIHLDHFTGAPTTSTTVGRGGYFTANNGAIVALGVTDSLTLHVDTDSTAGLIYGYNVGNLAGSQVSYPVNNLIIKGPGALTAQLSDGFAVSSFINVDARAAGDLNLSYFVPIQSFAGRNAGASGVFQLGDGANTLKVDMSSSNAVTIKFVLGAGVDNFVIGSFGNLAIAGDTVKTPSEIVGFQKGVDHIVLDGVVAAMTGGVQQYADGATSLTQALIQVSAHVAADTAAVFSYGGDSYLYKQDAVVGVNMSGTGGGAGDGLIKLVGVTGLTTATGAGVGDIHYG